MSDNGPHLIGKVYAFPGPWERGITSEQAARNLQRIPPLSPDEQAAIDARTSRRLPLWERIVCFVLDGLTRVVDAFTRWVER